MTSTAAHHHQVRASTTSVTHFIASVSTANALSCSSGASPVNVRRMMASNSGSADPESAGIASPALPATAAAVTADWRAASTCITCFTSAKACTWIEACNKAAVLVFGQCAGPAQHDNRLVQRVVSVSLEPGSRVRVFSEGTPRSGYSQDAILHFWPVDHVRTDLPEHGIMRVVHWVLLSLVDRQSSMVLGVQGETTRCSSSIKCSKT